MCHTLIIEDEPIIAMHLADLAEEAGASSVDMTNTQGAAVEAALRKKPDIILSDVRLLRGTGPAAVAIIHEQLGLVPVIFVTASPEQCQPCGPRAVIMQKPFKERELMRQFRRLAPGC